MAKTLIRHHAEKGRVVEAVVKTALRAILPGRFSIGTGFAITASGKISSQLDLIIYDAMFNAPIILEGGTGLFPIECIYGFVEVKSLLDAKAIDTATKAIGLVRSFAGEKRYVEYGTRKDEQNKDVTDEREFADELSPRSFVIAINAAYTSLDAVQKRLKAATFKNRAHLHGLAVLGRDWFLTQKPYRDSPEFVLHEGNSLAAFCACVLHTVQSMPMHPASMTRYLSLSA
ncbi:DUF6602 domain-containing protein [Inquilinus sp. CA228]|uniref:DUF6602 domain-containing protein n=1 Tax=Inquilinus sp. CA228 TaxID=3455609 RepID=UPI003F8D1C1E